MNKKDNNQSINEIFSVATNCHKKKNLKAAEENYRKILKINPKHIEANYYLGMLGYADDNFLLSPTLDWLQEMINTCDEYAKEHNLKFSTNGKWLSKMS